MAFSMDAITNSLKTFADINTDATDEAMQDSNTNI